MFVLMTVADTVRIPPSMFVQPTLTSVHSEIEKKYPNRVIMDGGLVICRYGDALEVGDGVLPQGDGCAHHEVVFRLVVFRPFVEEVLVGIVEESTEAGIRVSMMGFFNDIFIPAPRMQRPSHFDPKSGLWVWTPKYGDENQDQEGGVKTEEGGADGGEGDGDEEEEEESFEIEIGARIRFKVKAINFTRVTNTVKGVQATTTTTRHSTSAASVERTLSGGQGQKGAGGGGGGNSTSSPGGAAADGAPDEDDAEIMPVRKRSSSVDLSDSMSIPASMHITASICEEGLGLTSWWTSEEGDDDDDYDQEE